MLSVPPKFLTVLKLTRLNFESWFVNSVDLCGFEFYLDRRVSDVITSMAHCFDVITVQVLFSLACIFLVNPSSRTSCALWWNPHYWETWIKNWFNESDVRLVPLKFLVSCTIVCLPFSVRFSRNVDCFSWFSLLSVPAELSIIENDWAKFRNLICILFYFVRLWVLLSSYDFWVNRFSG